MSEMQMTVQEINALLEMGEIKRLAKKHGLKLARAYHILQGRRQLKDTDNQFINACFDLTLPRKQRNDKLKQIIK